MRGLAVLGLALLAGCGQLTPAENPRQGSAFPPCSGLLAGPMSMAGIGADGVPVGLAPNPNSPSDMCG